MTTATPRTTPVKNEFTVYLRISQLPKSVQSFLLVSEQQAKYVTPAFNSKWKWFSTPPYWHRRGREGQSELRADSFVFEVDEDYCPYPRVNVDEATKNHPGGIIDLQSSKNLGEWTYQIPSDPNLDGLSCLKKYISKRNVSREAFFQYPKRKGAEESYDVWYENRPLGVDKLQSMMKDISKAAALSQTFTNHFVRATAITLWSDAQISSRHIMNISRHAPQRREHQALQHEGFVKSTSLVFVMSCPLRVPLAKHFKPIVIRSSSRTTSNVGCSCSK